MRWRRLTFASRLALTSLLVTLIGMGLLAATLLLLVARYEDSRRSGELLETAQLEADYLSELASISELRSATAFLVERFAQDNDDVSGLTLRVFGLGGELLGSSSNRIGYFQSGAAQLLTRSPLPLLTDETQRRFVAQPVLIDGRQAAVLELSESLAEERRLLRLIALVLGQGTLLATVVVVALSVLLGRVLGRRFERLRLVAEGVAQGDLELRAPERGAYELQQLGRSLNSMAVQLKQRQMQSMAASERERRFYRDVAHELRTPLTALQGYLEDLEDLASTEQQLPLSALRAEVARLARLAGGLSEPPASSTLPMRSEPVDLAELSLGLVRALRGRAERSGVTLKAELLGSIPMVAGDPDRLKQALINLLDNALRHTPLGGTISLTLRPSPAGQTHAVELLVSDTGPGIDPALGESIWERGVRGAEGGSGLGLAIVREIAHAHGGSVELLKHGPGASFCLRLPLFTPVHSALTATQ